MTYFKDLCVAALDLTFYTLGVREIPSLDLKDPQLIKTFSSLGELVASAASFGEAALIEDKGVKQQILDLLASATGKLSRLNWLMFEDGDGDEDDFIFRGQAAQALSAVKFQYYAFTVNGATGQDELVKHLGEDRVSATEASLKSSVDEAEIFMRVGGGNTVLEKILGDRFKTQFETGTSGGTLSTRIRGDAEEWMFGYDPKNHAKDQRPLYGYLCRPNLVASEDLEGENTGGYGDIAIRFKSEVKNRATVTGNDSLNLDYLPSPVTNPSLVSFTRQHRIDLAATGSTFAISSLKGETTKLEQAKNLGDVQRGVERWGSYVEVQIHQQAKPSDIAEIIYMRGTPSPDVVAWAASNNVNIATGDEIKARAAAPDPSLDPIDSLSVA
jgi:hypothetical protein